MTAVFIRKGKRNLDTEARKGHTERKRHGEGGGGTRRIVTSTRSQERGTEQIFPQRLQSRDGQSQRK